MAPIILAQRMRTNRFWMKGVSTPSFLHNSDSPIPSTQQNFQSQIAPSTILESPFSSVGSSGNYTKSLQISQYIPNASPVESFIAAFNSTLHNSKNLPQIFDLSDLTAEVLSKSLYDYCYAVSVKAGHNNPHYIATTAAMPFKEGINVYSLPIMMEYYANFVANYLFDKHILNSSNVSFLARKLAKSMEGSGERNWIKGLPATKFLALQNGFGDFMTDLDQFNEENMEDLALYSTREIKRIGSRFQKNAALSRFQDYGSSVQIPSSIASPIESFTTALNIAISTSPVLPDIYDLSQFPTEAFSKSLYDYLFAVGEDLGVKNPHKVASTTALLIKECIQPFTLPKTIAKSIAKYLLSKAQNYAKFVENSAKRNWVKETPQSKFLALYDGYVDFFRSMNQWTPETLEELALYFHNEVERFVKQS